MVKIDLNTEQRWNDIFGRVEAGEVVQVMRGDRIIAVVEPADTLAEDEAYLHRLAEFGAQQLADAFPPNEYAEWDKLDGTR